MSNFITLESEENKIKLKNLFLVSIFIWFIWILFHFTIIFFFWLVLQSAILVWLVLWIWNFFALLIDIPVWVLQKYIKAKTFLLIWTWFIFLSLLIFLKFIYFWWIWWEFSSQTSWDSWVISLLWNFLWSSFNIILLLILSILYWVIKECFDVTTFSYIFNNSSPSEYAKLISKYNINFWIWALIWLLLSWILLTFKLKIAIFIFMIFVWIFIWFIITYFDNSQKSINLEDFKKLKNIKLDVIDLDLNKKTEQIISKITTKNLINLSRHTKIILLKPVEVKEKIDYKEIYNFTLEQLLRFRDIFLKKPFNILIIWVIILILQFWFWDTFVATFQIEFLNKVININTNSALISQSWWLITWYVLLSILILPAYLLQSFFINLSKKIWVYKVVMFWLILSSISLFLFWIVSWIYFVLLFWILNSVWYAAVMPITQATFWEIYNIEYAKKYSLHEIDTTISAAPLKIILNFANVIWLVFWWILVWILWFNWFFIFFSLVMFWILVWSFLNMKNFSLFWNNNSDKKIEDVIDPDFI